MRSRLQVLTWLSTTLFVVGQLAFALHLATVPHSYCAEHGEVSHAARGEGTDWHRLQGAAPVGVSAVTGAPDTAASAHTHRHCRVCESQRKRLTGPASRYFTMLAIPSRLVGTRPSAQIAPPRATLLSRAPKTSPPA